MLQIVPLLQTPFEKFKFVLQQEHDQQSDNQRVDTGGLSDSTAHDHGAAQSAGSFGLTSHTIQSVCDFLLVILHICNIFCTFAPELYKQYPMKSFFHVQDIGDLNLALEEARQVKANPYAWKHLGENKTIMLVFFNSSLRTRLSSQKAALNLGMSPIVLNIGQDSWQLETELGVIMDGGKSEHLREAIPVMASYCDIIGVPGGRRCADHFRPGRHV